MRCPLRSHRVHHSPGALIVPLRPGVPCEVRCMLADGLPCEAAAMTLCCVDEPADVAKCVLA